MTSVYSVGQVNAYIKNLIATDLMLGRIYVKGEVSNCKYHSSGHVYFTLKDETSAISCILFASYRRNVNFRLENGQKVIVFGRVSVYERDGSYGIYVSGIRLDGIGALYERFEALKKELADMGMFDAAYKKPIPSYVHRLGVVTAPTGAAVRDIITVSKRRSPGVQIILYPALVQGEGAAESIARGIAALDRFGVDVIIAGRGGGSYEDLWAFNEETVARAIFACETPVISAVGHETDTTIADFVADLRAPTPSAAAELACADTMDVVRRLADLKARQQNLMAEKIRGSRDQLERYSLRIKMHGPGGRLHDSQIRLSRIQDRMDAAMKQRIQLCRARYDRAVLRIPHGMEKKLSESKNRLAILEKSLLAHNPENRLKAGFAYVEDESGRRISAAADLSAGEKIRLHFSDGSAAAKVLETETGSGTKSDIKTEAQTINGREGRRADDRVDMNREGSTDA